MTTPDSPKDHDTIFLNHLKNETDGSISKTQLWRFVPINSASQESVIQAASVIQNYSATGLVINITDASTPLELCHRQDATQQSFYIDHSSMAL